ncbi:hypothetical protein Ddye_016776 [Dipteronia dyeriana]|uniref:MULE transposase domain-containing protein n=1 Tax=Dipteronia dyeriana TaxID=168575 RepID=A0AAD9U8A6_9ROSI|nr:hypothetical protein Ddye_016776 [Dipteronia dyeriana]
MISGEDEDRYLIFGALGHIDDLVFISDWHASIEAWISKVFHYATHTICCWHFSKNIKKRYHRKDVAVIVDKAARAYTELKYNRHMEELQNLHQNAFDYVNDFGPHKWSRVYYPDIRTAQSMRHQFTNASYLVILKLMEKYGFMIVNPINWNIFLVKSPEDLDMQQIPNGPSSCSHALIAARERNLDFTSLYADNYKRQTLIDAYSIPVIPVGHPSTWVVLSDIVERLVLNPIFRRQAGRSKTGQHILSSKRTTKQSCRRYGQLDYNSRRCSNPPLINEGPSRVVPEEYRCKCSICHSVGHNRQTCPNMDCTV